MSQDPFSPHEDVSSQYPPSSNCNLSYSAQDGFGPFTDPSGGTVSDSFTFSSSFSDEDSSFESFGDFGDFQAAEEHDGELTPTSGSWTFANEGGGSVENIGGGGGGGGGGSEVESGSNSSSLRM